MSSPTLDSKAPPKPPHSVSEHCPRGEDICPIYNEIIELKRSVKKLSEQVLTDSLTGLFNKRHLIATLETEMERTCRSHQPTSLIMLDVDHFKPFNDKHGHIAGDKVLHHVSLIIKNAIRKIDVACRYGGEEFSIILPSTPLVTATHVAERVRETIEGFQLNLDDCNLNITVSLGISCYTHNQHSNVEDLINRADQQLYKAKHQGRNRACVEVIQPEKPSTISEDERSILFPDDDD